MSPEYSTEDYHDVRDEMVFDDDLEWPCQQLHGGTGSAIYMNTDGMCHHPECHPTNDDRKPIQKEVKPRKT